jgi:hypothetical protein
MKIIVHVTSPASYLKASCSNLRQKMTTPELIQFPRQMLRKYLKVRYKHLLPTINLPNDTIQPTQLITLSKTKHGSELNAASWAIIPQKWVALPLTRRSDSQKTRNKVEHSLNLAFYYKFLIKWHNFYSFLRWHITLSINPARALASLFHDIWNDLWLTHHGSPVRGTVKAWSWPLPSIQLPLHPFI